MELLKQEKKKCLLGFGETRGQSTVLAVVHYKDKEMNSLKVKRLYG